MEVSEMASAVKGGVVTLVTAILTLGGFCPREASAAEPTAEQRNCEPGSGDCYLTTEHFEYLQRKLEELRKEQGEKLAAKADKSELDELKRRMDVIEALIAKMSAQPAQQVSVSSVEFPWALRWGLGLSVAKPFFVDGDGDEGVWGLRAGGHVGTESPHILGLRISGWLGAWSTEGKWAFTVGGGPDLTFSGSELGPVTLTLGVRGSHFVNPMEGENGFFQAYAPGGIELCLGETWRVRFEGGPTIDTKLIRLGGAWFGLGLTGGKCK
jgi:hypothetical protein